MTRDLIQELADLSIRVSAGVLHFVADREVAEQHGVDKIPAILVLGEQDPGIRFFGAPAGMVTPT